MVAPFLSVGALRQRVTLRQRTEVSDGQGGAVVTWPLLGVVWAAVNDSDGREQLLREGVLTAQSPTSVTVRYRSDLSVKDRIVWGTRTLDVASVADVNGKREYLRLACTEVSA